MSGHPSVAAFVSEIIRAANQVEKLPRLERTRLFQRASATLIDMGAPADIAHRFSEWGRLSDGLTDAEVSAALLDAVSEINTARRPDA